MRHPVPVLIGTVALIALFAWPVVRIQSDIPGATALPRDSESRQGYDLLLERFDAAALSPVEVLVTWSGEQDPFAYVVTARFLHVDMLARFHRGQRNRRVPVVRRRDADRVDLRVIDDRPEIFGLFYAIRIRQPLFNLSATLRVQVAHRHQVAIVE